ncbi:MAG TPA: pyruvate formate-lyase-activating protein [Pyrinomonadaceae bacterium]|nr:pyruvate formate-lyase-activating protein [Pyrinomonadaceae bacterium]
MSEVISPTEPLQSTPLEASSPFELRVNMSSGVSESVIKKALDSGDIGFLHSFTTGSTVDGPGVRVVAWTAGCQFQCLYCHNPDTWRLTNGMPVPLERATEELRKYRHGLKIMNGGLTLSGGEPLMQDRFAVRLFTAAKEMGIHTALDTNGFLGNRLSDDELEKIDLVLLDIKTWDLDRHRHLTGKDNGPILDFARRLAARKRPVWVRFVLVPGVTDNPADIEQTAQFSASLGNVSRVDVLPFHQLGRYKWKELGMNYTLYDVEPPAEEQVHRACEIFRGTGLVAH